MNRPDALPVAVIGAGLMGVAIGQVFASAGHRVAIHDTDPDALDRVHGRAAEIFALLGQDADDGLARIGVHRDLAGALDGAGLVVEAASEALEVKRRIFRDVLAVVGPDVPVATNTSGLPIGAITAGLPDAAQVLGAHFWHPPYLVPLVEVVATEQSADDVVARTLDLLGGAGFHPVLLHADVPGFVGNRLQHALKREAIALVAAGVCDARTVDEVVKFGFGLRLPVLGPLEQSDMIGLDLTLAIHESILPTLDVTPGPHPLLVEKVGRGERGMAVGKGFREWTDDEARELRARVTDHLLEAAARRRQASGGPSGGTR